MLNLKQTLKFMAYIPLFTLYCIVGLVYLPIKWMLYQVSDFDK